MSTTRTGTRWNDADVSRLKALAEEKTPTRLIAHKLQRTANAVRGKGSKEDVSLKPVNQSPYTRQNLNK